MFKKLLLCGNQQPSSCKMEKAQRLSRGGSRVFNNIRNRENLIYKIMI